MAKHSIRSNRHLRSIGDYFRLLFNNLIGLYFFIVQKVKKWLRPFRRLKGKVTLDHSDIKYKKAKKMMDETIRDHPTVFCGKFSSYKILEISENFNQRLMKGFKRRRRHLLKYSGEVNEKWLFHGSPNYFKIVKNGFDEARSVRQMFGSGIYFAEDSSKSNQYVYPDGKCPRHKIIDCYTCWRYLILCRVMLGKTHTTSASTSLDSLPGFDSISAEPSANLKYKEYIIRKGDQTYPTYVIKYIIQP